MIYLNYRWLILLSPFILMDITFSMFRSHRFWIGVFAVLIIIIGAATAKAEALDEVNLQRRGWGQKQLIRNPELVKAAQKIAEWQAYYQISLQTGYTGHEHPKYNPPGTSVGTGVSSAYGWSSCLMEVYGSYQARAGVAIGADGRRYMVLVLKGSNHPGCRNGVMMAHTKHLTPNARIVGKASQSPPAYPRGRSHPPGDYSMYPLPSQEKRVSVLDSATVLVSFKRIIIPTSQTFCPVCEVLHD